MQQICFLVSDDTSGKYQAHVASVRNQSGALRFGTLSSESSGRVLFPSLCHGCTRLFMIMCIDMMTFTGIDFDSDGLRLSYGCS